MDFKFDELCSMFNEKNFTDLLFNKMDKHNGIKRRVCNLGKQPINPSYINNFSPAIFRSATSDSFVFCIKDIVKDLFEMRKTSKKKDRHGDIVITKNAKLPLAFLPDYDQYFSKNENYLSFLLPKRYLDKIISDDLLPNDYLEFLLETKRLNKITNRILSMFQQDRNTFVDETRRHMINNLKSADYSNPCLIPYLYTVGYYIIVPHEVSSESNNSFMHTLEKNSHEDISTIIANFFISSMLGLYNINFVKTSSDDSRYTRKVYLLNDWGMRYIWMSIPITPSYEALNKIQSYYQLGHYKEAYEQLGEWLKDYNSNAESTELALAYQLLGSCMFLHPSECCSIEKMENETKANGAANLQKCIETEKASSEVYYLLYQYYTDSACREYNHEKALENLRKAFTLNNVNAVIEVTNLILRNIEEKNFLVGLGIRPDKALEKLNSLIEKSEQYSSVGISECLYLRGSMQKMFEGDLRKAEQDFATAAQKGHEKAKQQISRIARANQMTLPAFSSENSTKYCFANTLSGNNLLTLTTFPSDEWEVFSTEKEVPSLMGVKQISSIDEFLKCININTPTAGEQRAVILLMSSDENKNLNDCLLLLDKLFNIALDASETQRYYLTDILDIYVQATFETASMLIDASLCDMGEDIYFKVHIEDTEKEAAHQLLCDAPLFIPFLEAQKEKSSNVILLGSTNTSYSIIKEAIACTYMGENYPISLTMLGSQAEHYKAKLHRECPGLFQKDHVTCIVPEFLSCDLTELDLPSYIYGHDFENSTEDPIVKTLAVGNYFVVDFGNDLQSIQFAMELRTWLLRSRGTFDRTPFIAVKCSDERSAYLAEHLAVSSRAPGSTYFSRYNLFAFGISKQIYAYKKMIEDGILEKIAMNIHRSYCENMTTRQIENDFYSYSYNLDSSVCTALGLSYRMFAANVYFKDVLDYRDGGILYPSELYAEYSRKIDEIIEYAAAIEQSRWNGYVLSRAWLPADANKIAAYKEQSTGSSHRHLLAKYHPFILEWNDIQDEKIMKVLRILKSKFDYDKSPQEITRRSIRDTAKFVEQAHFKSESTER